MNDLSAEYALLGVNPLAKDADVVAARRRAAFNVHPDRGGSHGAMAKVNAAFATIMKVRRAVAIDQGSDVEPSRVQSAPSSMSDGLPKRPVLWCDAPSFTINLLPVEAFEYLLIAAQELGDIVDTDPPYILEVIMHPHSGRHSIGEQWCRLELFPDAGSSTVSLICEVSQEDEREAESCRDRWVEAVNALDAIPGDQSRC